MACASVTSEPEPQAGQSERSSGNFSTENCVGKQLKWSCPQGLSFDVKKDRSAASDPTIFSGVANGTITTIEKERSLYIANPKNAVENFLVEVEGVG